MTKSEIAAPSNTPNELVKATLDPKRYDEKRIKVQMFAGNCIFGLYHRLFTRIKVYGRENIPKEGSLIFVGNHKSYYDPPLYAFATQRHMIYFAKQELWDNPNMGKFLSWLGALPVNRQKPEISRIKFIREIMKTGWSLGLFIEGTRCKVPGKLGRPNIGPAYFAKTTKSPIVPIGFINTDKRFGPVIVKIGKPIPWSDDLEGKTWEIMDALAELTGYEILERKLAKDD